MENIIKKAIEGGWKPVSQIESIDRIQFSLYGRPAVSFWYKNGNGDKWALGDVFTSSLFWQALGKACGWGYANENEPDVPPQWLDIAKYFYELNLTEGWDKAIEYLTSLIK